MTNNARDWLLKYVFTFFLAFWNQYFERNNRIVIVHSLALAAVSLYRSRELSA